jgi:hypothetical protein
MNRLKIGDEVTVVDRAWSKILNGANTGKRVRAYSRSGAWRKFQVIAMGKFPLDVPLTPDEAFGPVPQVWCADMLIASVDEPDQELVIINRCNLHLYKYNLSHVRIKYTMGGCDVTNKLSECDKSRVLALRSRELEV